MKFEEIIENLLSDGEIEVDIPEDVLDVSKMSIQELVEIFDDLNQKLFEIGEALNPTNQTSRDMHSLRNAVKLELSMRSK